MGIILKAILLIGICIALLAMGIIIPKTFAGHIALLGMAIFIVAGFAYLYRVVVKKGKFVLEFVLK